jgi:hypothetical protein
MQDPKDKKAIMADAYSDKRVNELKKATNTPYQMEMASKKLGSMKKKKEDAPRKMGLIFDKESFEKLPSFENKMKSDKMNERKSVTEQLKKYNDTSVMKSNKRY